MKINIEELKKRDNYINCQKHDTLDLLIWNYSHKCQFDRAWDDYTEQARGLITDLEGNIVARCFRKFFNIGETEKTKIEELPYAKPTVYEKFDGCFHSGMKLNLWNGGTIKIGKVVREKLDPILIGMDKNGKIVPCKILDYFDNGTKQQWLEIKVNCNVSKKSGCRTGNKILVTPNHYFYMNEHYRPVTQIKKGDELTTFEYIPDRKTLHLIESGLLGDGSLSFTHGAVRYSEVHKLAHKDYTNEIFKQLGSCAIKQRVGISGYGTKMIIISSKAYKSLIFLRHKWYPKGKKIIPKELEWINNFSIAKWYMDDGSLSHHSGQQDRAVFSTNSFEKEDVERLASVLIKKYNISCTIYYSKGWNVRINSGKYHEINKFWEAISPHIVSCMKYKLPPTYRNVPYVVGVKGEENVIHKKIKVKKIRVNPSDNWHLRCGKKGFDIKTSTGNYFIKGILVHNSLGIQYYDGDKVCITTRGSFNSEQAIWATKWMEGFSKSDFLAGFTYLYEIIYKENRIVVDYKGKEELVLLAVISTETGVEVDVVEEAKRLGLSRPKIINKNIATLTEYTKEMPADEEGFVLKYPNLRLKMKGEEYLRLHRLITGFSTKSIWECLKNGDNIEELLKDVQDEFYKWVEEKRDELMMKAKELKKSAQRGFIGVAGLPTRKEQALAIMKDYKDISGLVFGLLDNKNIHEQLWKMIKPKYELPFKKEV